MEKLLNSKRKSKLSFITDINDVCLQTEVATFFGNLVFQNIDLVLKTSLYLISACVKH